MRAILCITEGDTMGIRKYDNYYHDCSNPLSVLSGMTNSVDVKIDKFS